MTMQQSLKHVYLDRKNITTKTVKLFYRFFFASSILSDSVILTEYMSVILTVYMYVGLLNNVEQHANIDLNNDVDNRGLATV